VDGGPITPIKFRTDVKKTLCYVYFGLWGYTKENNAGTIGKMWVDEVVLKELPRIAGSLKGIGRYYFFNDEIKGTLFSNSYDGKVTLKVSAQKGKSVTKVISVKPGENSFTISWEAFPEGKAVLSAVGGDISVNSGNSLRYTSHPLNIVR
jgi:hypothetical protein